jgi:hypothetical protein
MQLYFFLTIDTVGHAFYSSVEGVNSKMVKLSFRMDIWLWARDRNYACTCDVESDVDNDRLSYDFDIELNPFFQCASISAWNKYGRSTVPHQCIPIRVVNAVSCKSRIVTTKLTSHMPYCDHAIIHCNDEKFLSVSLSSRALSIDWYMIRNSISLAFNEDAKFILRSHRVDIDLSWKKVVSYWDKY